MQARQLDEYTEQTQRSQIDETHQIRELKKKKLNNLKTKAPFYSTVGGKIINIYPTELMLLCSIANYLSFQLF